MNAVRGVLGTLLFCLSLLAMGCAPKASDIVVLEVGPHQVSLDEYENFYARNSVNRDSAGRSSIEERGRFLDLLANYKLKLQDAYDRNLYNDTDVVREL